MPSDLRGSLSHSDRSAQQVQAAHLEGDELGLWLLSGDGPRPSLPVMDDAEPFDYAEMELMQAGMWATTKILHSTS